MLVVFQLAITGLHELSEAQWLPSSRTEMAIVGPIVRNDLFFFVFIFGAAALLVMREWHNARLASAVTRAANDAEKRLLESQNRRQRRWMVAAASACLIVIMALTADFIYAKANSAEARVSALTVQGANVRVPIASVNDGDMHLFSADVGAGKIVRFMIIKKPTGWGTALDACRICGAEGYRQDGQNVVCRHCGSAIYVPTIGEAGGCNPIGVPSRVDGTDLVLDISALSQATHEIPN